MLPLRRDATWLFIGDSITDAGRREDASGLGHGYVKLVHDYLVARSPAEAPRVVNRGVGGDRIVDLEARWQRDVIDERPDVLSVKIGVNDVWRQLDGKAPGVPLSRFREAYARLLDDVADALPACKVVLVEPSVISPPAPKGNEMVADYAAAVGELAADRPGQVAAIVPMFVACREAERARPDAAWWPDGVHPSPLGCMLMARTWLAAVDLL